jgi:non-heme chloroperoxidase
MKVFVVVAGTIFGLLVLAIVAAFVLVASPPPPMPEPKDVFGFASSGKIPATTDPPPLQRYPARDGEQLAYRFYDSTAERILIFIHGSSYHGGGYHALASYLSGQGAAKVVLPNLRGHYMSGRRRGDIDYVGQLEDDLVDLIAYLRAEHRSGQMTLGGHSSGGGLAIRFAGGGHAEAGVSSYLLLAPFIPRAPSVRGGNAGGWASLNFKRLFGLLALNAIGIHGFNGLPLIAFNKPVQFWDGTETLSYSYRLNVSYHPRSYYHGGVRRRRSAGAGHNARRHQSFRHLLPAGRAGSGRGLAARSAGRRPIAPRLLGLTIASRAVASPFRNIAARS